MKKPIKLGFADFEINWGPWPDPVKFFVDTLKDAYDIAVVKSDFCGQRIDTGEAPDFVICATPGQEHLKYDCPKIYFPGEPREVNLTNYQYALTYNLSEDERHFRLPLYALYADVTKLISLPPVKEPPKEFCCVLFGKTYPHNETPREAFFKRLSEYKPVHSAGKLFNNTGFVIMPDGKAQFIRNYKFVLSFESCALPGFTTEKCFEPLLMNTVPVYWGNPKVGLDFDTRRLINCNEYDDLDDAIQRIAKIDSDDSLYYDLTTWPAMPHNVVNEYARKEKIVEFFQGIFG